MAKKETASKPKARPKSKKKTAKRAKAKAKPKAKPRPKPKVKVKGARGASKTAPKRAAVRKGRKAPPPPPLKGVATALVPIITDDGAVQMPQTPAKVTRPRKLRPAQVSEIRELLLNRREELLREITEEIDQSQMGAKQRSADPTDQASDSADGDLALALAQSDTNELQQIEGALGRIRSGELGVCEECGGGIPMERLRALPYATTCIDCKRRMELQSTADGLEEAWEAVHESEEEKGGEDD